MQHLLFLDLRLKNCKTDDSSSFRGLYSFIYALLPKRDIIDIFLESAGSGRESFLDEILKENGKISLRKTIKGKKYLYYLRGIVSLI